jgi:hypothetical protein
VLEEDDMHKWFTLILLSVSGCLSAEPRPAVQELAPEVRRLMEKKPLKELTGIEIESATAWVEFPPEKPIRRIIIINEGKDINIKKLRHEWDHLYRKDSGDPNWKDEGPAKKAEEVE